MDNRLREIEQWVAEARDGLDDGGREAYVRKLYLLDAEIRAVIKDSGILPQADSPRPALSPVRRLTSLALPAAGVIAVLAVSTLYLRGGVPALVAGLKTRATESRATEVATSNATSILTARPESAQKNTPPAGPSSTPHNWHEYLASNGEEVVRLTEDGPAGAPARHQSKLAKVELALTTKDQEIEGVGSHPHPGRGQGPAPSDAFTVTGQRPAPPTVAALKQPVILASAKKPAPANDSTNVAAGVQIMNASYAPSVQRPLAEAAAPSAALAGESHKLVKSDKKIIAASDLKDVKPRLDQAALKEKLESTFSR